MMQTRHLGKTDQRVSALGFGCMGLVGWYGTRNDAESRATLIEAMDRGVTHLDTAAAYQNGDNERFVGEAIRGRRDGLFLATKFGIGRSADGKPLADNRPEAVKASCEASLERLGVERIDLFYLHRIDRSVAIEDAVGALADLVAAGKIRYAGLSECGVATLRRACAVHPIAAVQSEYSLWVRDPEQGVLTACRELGVGFVPYSPLGRGFLAGNFRSLDDLPADDNRRMVPRFQDASIEHNLAIADAVRDFARRKGCTPAQLALAWVLAQGDDILPIPGMKTRAHLADNLGALEVRLSPEERDELTRTVEQLKVLGERQAPAMMQLLDR
jgi:aryl-alcohol dehydrogenase-like predicted oxidoreductase